MSTQKSFDRCKTAISQYKWLIKNKDGGFKIVMDNDYTWIDFGEDKDGYSITSDFKEYLGQSDGAILLLTALGINSEYC